MPIIEKLGSFFLGKEYDLAKRQLLQDRPVNYDSRDLTTHAVCVGMTGSGKTGLCIDLLEEAALDGVPAILIDPKGDITNLLLTFPDLRPEDFLPWINPDDARRKGHDARKNSPPRPAQTWREGLASWEQGPERIRALKDAADFAIYTPGSDAGLPVSIISSFKAPGAGLGDRSGDAARAHRRAPCRRCWGWSGIEADPVRSREHILLSTILENAWRAGRGPGPGQADHGRAEAAVPPGGRVRRGHLLPGEGPLRAGHGAEQHHRLAQLRRLAAGRAAGHRQPALHAGRQAAAQHLLHRPPQRRRAHVLRHDPAGADHQLDARASRAPPACARCSTWTRCSATSRPSANPPSKRPLLTLLKQARAFGVGMVLTTQNPVDLDYKGLTNAGTWFIGKLQAERDKARLLDGLEGALAQGGACTDRGELDRLISALESRVFLLHNVNQSSPVVFQTRWAMSYLRGPLTRQQIKTLMADRKAGQARPPDRRAGLSPQRPPPKHGPAQASRRTGRVPGGPGRLQRPSRPCCRPASNRSFCL